MKKKFMRTKLNASATIEAAYIIPIIFFSLIAVIYLVFYLYDIMRAEADADRLLFEMEKEYELYGDREIPEGKDVSGQLKGYLQAETVEAYITMLDGQYMVEVIVNMDDFKVPILNKHLFPEIYIVRTKEIMDRTDRTRLIEAVINTVEGLSQRINGR